MTPISFSVGAVPKGNQKMYRSPFFRDFWHLNVAMMTSNNALVPDAEKADSLASSPVDWPFLYSGMRMNGWGDTNSKYYLVGNPIVWWSGAVSLLVFVVTSGWYLARFQRKYNDFAPGGSIPSSFAFSALTRRGGTLIGRTMGPFCICGKAHSRRLAFAFLYVCLLTTPDG
jgi:hypothetical protein